MLEATHVHVQYERETEKKKSHMLRTLRMQRLAPDDSASCDVRALSLSLSLRYLGRLLSKLSRLLPHLGSLPPPFVALFVRAALAGKLEIAAASRYPLLVSCVVTHHPASKYSGKMQF